MRTNTVATLFNHYTDKITEKTLYKRTVITSVNWQSKQIVNATDKGLVSEDEIMVFIPHNSDFEGKEYIDPKSFRQLSDENKNNYFTFDNNDYIVKCEVDESLSVDNIKKSYDNVAVIISVINCNNGSRTRHFEVMGK